MNYFYIKQEAEATVLILFFNGWSMDETAIRHLELPKGTDLLTVQDYRKTEFDPPCDLSKYKEIHLVGWSMGVWGAEQAAIKKQLPPYTTATAIAGTPFPMDNTRGIPRLMFMATLKSISEENRKRFNKRMCGGKSMKHLLETLEKRTTEEVRDELKTVLDASLEYLNGTPAPETIKWDHALIPQKDLIIPVDNQVNYWSERNVPYTILEETEHYVFSKFTKWSEIIPSKN